MATSALEANGNRVSWVLKHANIPHTALDKKKSYSFSDISDNCRANNATFLRMQLPGGNVSFAKKLAQLSTTVPEGKYMLVWVREDGGEEGATDSGKGRAKDGTKGSTKGGAKGGKKDPTGTRETLYCGLVVKTAEKVGSYCDIEQPDEIDISAAACEGTHPLKGRFADAVLMFFLADKFDKTHLVLPGLYRKRKAKQLAKHIAKSAEKKEMKKGGVVKSGELKRKKAKIWRR